MNAEAAGRALLGRWAVWASRASQGHLGALLDHRRSYSAGAAAYCEWRGWCKAKLQLLASLRPTGTPAATVAAIVGPAVSSERVLPRAMHTIASSSC